jgi:hypothetical protein
MSPALLPSSSTRRFVFADRSDLHPPRDHEHMPRRHGERIEDREGERARAEPLRFRDQRKGRRASSMAEECTSPSTRSPSVS